MYYTHNSTSHLPFPRGVRQQRLVFNILEAPNPNHKLLEQAEGHTSKFICTQTPTQSPSSLLWQSHRDYCYKAQFSCTFDSTGCKQFAWIRSCYEVGVDDKPAAQICYCICLNSRALGSHFSATWIPIWARVWPQQEPFSSWSDSFHCFTSNSSFVFPSLLDPGEHTLSPDLH